MWKKLLLLTCLSVLLALPAFATGVDQVIYGADEFGTDQMGSMPDNEDDLYTGHHNHGASIPGDNGDGIDPSSDDGSSDVPGDGNDDGGNAPVPEPATGILLGAGVLSLTRFLRRRQVS